MRQYYLLGANNLECSVWRSGHQGAALRTGPRRPAPPPPTCHILPEHSKKEVLNTTSVTVVKGRDRHAENQPQKHSGSDLAACQVHISVTQWYAYKVLQIHFQINHKHVWEWNYVNIWHYIQLNSIYLISLYLRQLVVTFKARRRRRTLNESLKISLAMIFCHTLLQLINKVTFIS